MFPGSSNIVIYGGTFNNQTNSGHTNSRAGRDILLDWIAPGAFYNSDELYAAPKCHPHTRVAVIGDIMQWVNESHIDGDDFMLWLFGPAGSGKSAIAKRIAELAAEKGLLIATFFFSRTSPTRSFKDRLIATLAYQLALSIPDTRTHIEDAIGQDPAIFMKNIQTQIDTLLIKPLQFALPTQVVPFPKLFVIDGLDECNDIQAQIAVLHAISHSLHKYNLPILFLVVSRPEQHIFTLFNNFKPLKFIHRRLALDDSYQPDSDIYLFFSDKFEEIKDTHPLRSTIPTSWPTEQSLEKLVRKSSGQFIYAATVIRFVESHRHRPTGRLKIILGIDPGDNNPFAELDALYHHILSSVDDIQATLSVLSLYLATPYVQIMFHGIELVERFLSLEQGDVHLVLSHLSSIVSFDEPFGEVKILHASFVDFLLDRRRSTIFHIDIATACADFVHRIFQCITAPDGIRAGDVDLLWGLFELIRRVPRDQFLSAILTFDFDAFMKAVNQRYSHKGPAYSSGIGNRMVSAFQTWTAILATVDLEDGDRKAAVDRCNKSLESRLQIYQSDWRLQILLTFAATNINITTYLRSEVDFWVPSCRCTDILLDLDDHNLHLADQRALDLRHAYRAHFSSAGLINMITPYVNGDRYASAALHCLCFLSKPPIYSRSSDPEIGLIYSEWRATCDMTLGMACKLLQGANTSPELVDFLSNNDIHRSVQKRLPAIRIWWVELHILAFLSRVDVCINWRVISVIQRAPFATDRQHKSKENDTRANRERDRSSSRLDQCCVERHLSMPT